MYDRVKNASKYRIMRIFVKMREHCVNRYGYNSFLCGDPRSGHDFLRGLYICRSHRRQRHLRPPFSPIFTVFLSISIALLPRALSDFYLLHTFAEEFTSVVCDPSHRVPHPLIKDCATDIPSPTSLLRTAMVLATLTSLRPACDETQVGERIGEQSTPIFTWQ